jgi:hypothetical protein
LLQRFDLVQLLLDFVLIQQQNYQSQRQYKEEDERQNKNTTKS